MKNYLCPDIGSYDGVGQDATELLGDVEGVHCGDLDRNKGEMEV